MPDPTTGPSASAPVPAPVPAPPLPVEAELNVDPVPPPVSAPPAGPVDPADRPGGVNPVAVLAAIAGFVCPPAGIWLGYVARRQIDRTAQAGAALAFAGIVAGIINSVLLVTAALLVLTTYGALLMALSLGQASQEDPTGTGPAVTSPAEPASPEQIMIWDAEEMARLQWQYRDKHPGALGHPVDPAIWHTMVGDVPFQGHAENRVRVVLADRTDLMPDGGFCVVVTNPAVADPLLFDSAIIQGGSFLDDAMTGIAPVACATVPEVTRS